MDFRRVCDKNKHHPQMKQHLQKDKNRGNVNVKKATKTTTKIRLSLNA